MDLERHFKIEFVNLGAQLLIFDLKRVRLIIVIWFQIFVLGKFYYKFSDQSKIFHWAESKHSFLLPNNKYKKSKLIAQVQER